MTVLERISDVLFWLCLFSLLWYAYILLVHKGVPNIRTAPAIRRRIIERLKQDYEERKEALGDKPYTIIELGCANGQFSRHIARELPQARVIGIEWAGPAYLMAQKQKEFYKVDNLSHEKADFFARDVSEADAVVFYLTAYEMGRLAEKFEKELKKDAIIISNRFLLHAPWEPKETVRVRTFSPHQRSFHLYRKD